jgi:type IV pilus assembly protein PilY1
MTISRAMTALRLTLAAATAFAAAASSALTFPNVPLVATPTAKPMAMLVASKDHKLFYEAYNDAGDVDGDGTLDFKFKPSITYTGLFDPTLCYTHNNSSTNTGLFTPSGAATSGKCSNAWSGNWLNYVTTSRIDALRVVLYGGHREVDTSAQTILRRAYIPQDAHSWAKEYTSETFDGYKISDYTPLAEPTGSNRHFFGNLTANATTNCATLSNCSNLPPWLSVVTNSNKRVWEWASKERPVLDGTHGGTRTDYTVRVEVCTATYNTGCKSYGSSPVVYKPIGLLHDYGETELMLFGLLTGSYDKNMSGGVLRKVMSSFKNEIDSTTGVFNGSATIVQTFNNLRIRDYNNGYTDQRYAGGWHATSAMTQGTFPDWGNPIGEMIYESLRYFAGRGAATSDYVTASPPKDTAVGLPVATWDDPYSSGSTANAPSCSKANILAISDPNPSFDSDQIPGSDFNSYTGDLTGFNAKTESDTITTNETGIASSSRFIGQSGNTSDSAPTAKTVTSLGSIRGLPEEPTKQGSYYAAAAAYFGKRSDLRADKTGTQSVDFFSVVLASPLPKIEAKLPNGKVIAMVPFAKTIAGLSVNAAKSSFQPSNQIVDFYVDTIANSGTADADSSVNGGRYYAKFRINFEDVEQGADHDMDAISEYEVIANADNTLTVRVTPLYQAGGARQNMGYILSGTTVDGVHLVVQDENVSGSYYLNVPPSRSPGYCDVTTPPADCNLLPYIGGAGAYARSDVTYSPGSSTASTLNNPLWYAAKWGGFIDKNGNNRPDLQAEWDADGDGVPDSYSEVQNPLKLKERLRRAMEDIIERNASSSNVAANSTSISSSTEVYQATFNTTRWSGNVAAYSLTTSGLSSTAVWEAGNAIPSPTNRKIYVNTSGGAKPFTWGDLPSTEQTALVNSANVDYLRGVRTQERQNGGTLRDRTTHVLGDIVHSTPYYVKDNDHLFVGANDGMLHAISAISGTETFAFIPRQVVSRLKNLSSVGYSHEYFVDGDVVVTSQTQTPSKNFLFATLGRGGKGLFALDVTSPSTFSEANFLWEYTPTGNSSSASTDNDLGFMLGQPLLARMNDGTIGLIVGNGYNSTNGRAVLYIFRINASTGAILSIKKIDTTVGSDNGLATPGLVDTNADGRVDVIYAGDLKGNVWKFDVSGASDTSWGLALSGSALFTAKDSSNNRQPITSGIISVVNDQTGDPNVNKRFVFFGTGKYLESADSTSTGTQTWYGIIDENSAIANRSNMVSRSITATSTFSVSGETQKVRVFGTGTASQMSGKNGWYLDFTLASDAGERIVVTSNFFKKAEPILQGSSMIPVTTNQCLSGGRGYINALNPFTGARLTNPLFDLNRNNSFADEYIGTTSAYIGSFDPGVGQPGQARIIGSELVVGGSGGETGKSRDSFRINDPNSARKGRISWREIVTD